MAKRIRDIVSTATSPASDDYLAIDGTTNNTRRLLASYFEGRDTTAVSFSTGTLTLTRTAGNLTVSLDGRYSLIGHTHAITDITMATARLLGRTTAASGAAEEISVGAGLSFSAGSLALASAINPSSIGATTPGTGTFTSVTLGDGTAGSPGLRWTSDPDTGFLKEATGRIAVSIDGTIRTYFDSVSIQVPAGSAAGPGFRFSAETNTGMFRETTNVIGWSIAGTQRMTLTATGINNTAIGATTAAAGTFTTLTANSGAVINGGSLTVNSTVSCRNLFTLNGNTADAVFNPRGASGYKTYIQFTEDSVADRWSVGCLNGDAALYFRTGGSLTGTTIAAIAPTGIGLGGSTVAGYQVFVSGTMSGDSSRGLHVGTTLTATANTQSFFGSVISPTIARSTFTGLTYYADYIASASLTGTGTINVAYQLYIAAAPTATTTYGIYQNASDQNYLGGALTVQGNVGIGGFWSAGYGLAIGSSVSGDSTSIFRAMGTMTATANNQSFYQSIVSSGTVARSTFTGLNYFGFYVNTPSLTGTGTIGIAYQIYLAGSPAATTKYGIYQAAADANYLSGNLTVLGGIIAGTPTGGDKGAGTINVATDIYKNNTAYTNPDYVLEHWATGAIRKFGHKEGARDYNGLAPLAEVKDFVRRKWHLPRFGQDAAHGLFSGGDAMLASLEEAYLYIFELEDRLRKLEARTP